ncbi:farnesyl cysteine-carboxyl methyltransferase [Coniothyrium glycines]
MGASVTTLGSRRDQTLRRGQRCTAQYEDTTTGVLLFSLWSPSVRCLAFDRRFLPAEHAVNLAVPAESHDSAHLVCAIASHVSLAASSIAMTLSSDRLQHGGTYTPEPDAREDTSTTAVGADFYPHGKRSLSGIAVRGFCLGMTAVLGFGLCAILVYHDSHLWRPCFFMGVLAVFHFLEFYITAAYNTPIAYVSSFLLTNGSAYRQAHTAALIETCFTSYFLPAWQDRFHGLLLIAVGVVMIAVGQTVRSIAMAQAGTNFNHTVQSKKTAGHELVTTGLYAYCRHPSYFGFFWWGIGTQVVIGNTICLLAYAGVLWYFFWKRISHEEKHLVAFFGDDYKAYRARTRVWIPFVR